MTAFQKNEKLLVHLVNGSGNPSVQSTPLLAAMTVRVPGRQLNEAFLHTPTKEVLALKITRSEKESSLTVPQLEAYGLLEVR